jgi:hypothetical protein
MTNLKKLEKDIREKLPRLMELRVGCNLVESLTGLQHKIIAHGSTVGDCTLFPVYGEFYGQMIWTDSVDFKKYEIIGHDPMLNDVMEWYFMLKNKDYGKDGFIIESTVKYFNWYLSKPYLKDQPEGLINYLTGLI